MFKNRDERKRQKDLKHLEEIAKAFLKARGVYPPEYDGFLEIAGEKQVNLFYATMHILETKAYQMGYVFDWWFDQVINEWVHVFSERSVDCVFDG